MFGQLYPSGPQTLYADLLKPVTLASENDYGLAIYSSQPIGIPGGDWGTGMLGLTQFEDMNPRYNPYSIPIGVKLMEGERKRPITATGCLDDSQFRQPGQTDYAFCALIETYQRQPPNNRNPQVTSLTNVTRYSGVIVTQNNITVKTDYGVGYPITYMEGYVQSSTNAGAFVYPPLGLRATPFFYRSAKRSIFADASDLLYPNMSIPIDKTGIVITTPRNQSNLFWTNVSIDSTIGQRGETGTIKTYFSSFHIYPRSELEDVITECNVPIGFEYKQDMFQCPSDAAPVSFGDMDLNDLDPVGLDPQNNRLPPNLISFRFFIPYTPDTTIYQLTYYTYANPVAIIHMRLGLFSTNTSYVASFSALPQYQLIEETEEIELVNVDDTTIIANLKTPQKLIQNKTYAIGVWSDTLLYGPQAQWGENAAGANLPYNTIGEDGQFPKQILALGGQTGVQPMAAVGCVAKERLITVPWCATFGHYFETDRGWMLDRHEYTGTLWGLSTLYHNEWGSYHIMTAGNGTYQETLQRVEDPPDPTYWRAKQAEDVKAGRRHADGRPVGRGFSNGRAGGIWSRPCTARCTRLLRRPACIFCVIACRLPLLCCMCLSRRALHRNLNNFVTQSQDFIYVESKSGLSVDVNGFTMVLNIENEWEQVVFAVTINAIQNRGSPVYTLQEAGWYNSGYEMHIVVNNASAPAPECPLAVEDVAWNLVFLDVEPFTFPFITACTGMAQMQSTYGDNRVADYVDDYEGHTLKKGIVYTYNFTAKAGNVIRQISIDILNNTHLDMWVNAYLGIYGADGTLLSEAVPINFLEPWDMMVVSDMDPVYVKEDGLFYVAITFDHDFFVATGTSTGLSMTHTGRGLPMTFKPDGVSRAPPLVAYGCVTSSHYFCGSFQYYQGDDYSPVALDYLYQGLLLAEGPNGTNANGFWQSILYGVGYFTTYVRIARYASNFVTGWTDIMLTRPGNATNNYIYTDGNGGAALDGIGLSFITTDDYGYEVTISYNATTGLYADSTDPQMGVQLLQTFVIKPVNFSAGLPQCSFLYLESDIQPVSSLANKSVCHENNAPVRWGDADPTDYFYDEEGMSTNYYTDITLSPFNTGPTYSNVTQLVLNIGANANVFAHVRMALYLNNTLLAESDEVTLENPQDATLYFTLNQTVTLFPASLYYIAMWTDVTLYMAAGWDYSGLCYYGITYGYDLQPWPATVGSVEALYTNCHPIAVAALGCAVAGGAPYVPPVDPNCPPSNGTQARLRGEARRLLGRLRVRQYARQLCRVHPRHAAGRVVCHHRQVQ